MRLQCVAGVRHRIAALIAVAGLVLMAGTALAQTSPPPPSPAGSEAQIAALVPDLERYVKAGTAAFDVPGAAVGIVADDRLVYSRGFGVRRKGGNESVDTKTVFQIGSTTKAFLATTLAIAVDRGKLKWNDRVVDLGPTELRPDAGALVATLEETGARLRLEPFDGAVFTVRLLPEGRFAAVVASLGDTPLGFADLEAGPSGRLTQLHWSVEGQWYLWRKNQQRGAE